MQPAHIALTRNGFDPALIVPTQHGAHARLDGMLAVLTHCAGKWHATTSIGPASGYAARKDATVALRHALPDAPPLP